MTELQKLFPKHNIIPMGKFMYDPLGGEMYLAVPKKRLTNKEWLAKCKRIDALFSCAPINI